MKKPTTRKDLLKERTIFCTQCDAELENFCFSRGAEDIEAIKKTLDQCKRKGKFVGEFCAKLFVADPRTLDTLWDDE